MRILTLLCLFTTCNLVHADDSLRNLMQTIGQHTQSLGTSIRKDEITETSLQQAKELSAALLAAEKLVPTVLESLTPEEREHELKFYRGLIFQTYGQSLELQYQLEKKDRAESFSVLRAMLGLRNRGHKFFKPSDKG